MNTQDPNGWLASYMAGMKAFAENKHPEAIAHYKKALEQDADNVDVLGALAMSLSNSNEHDEAIAMGHRISELDPDDPMIHTSLSMFYQRRGMHKEQPADIELAEEQAAVHRMKSWKQDLKKNPNAPPPSEDGDSLGVIQ